MRLIFLYFRCSLLPFRIVFVVDVIIHVVTGDKTHTLIYNSTKVLETYKLMQQFSSRTGITIAYVREDY